MDNRKRGYDYAGLSQSGYDASRQPGPPQKRGPATVQPIYPTTGSIASTLYPQQVGYPGGSYPQFHQGYGPSGTQPAGYPYAQPPYGGNPYQNFQTQQPSSQTQVHSGKPGRSDEFFLEEDGSKRPVVRVLCTPNEFSKVIGKGGNTIASIRSTHDVFIRGMDVFKEYRLIVIAGELNNLHGACNAVAEILNKSSVDPQSFRMTLLADQSKTGKIVGTRGTLLQALKSNSGITSIQVHKEPTMIYGVSLRSIAIDGNLQSVQKCVNMISDAIYGDVPPTRDDQSPRDSSHQLSRNNSSTHSVSSPGAATPTIPVVKPPIVEFLSLDNLRDDIKVPNEIISQIKYYKDYLLQYYDIELVCRKKEGSNNRVEQSSKDDDDEEGSL